MLREEVSVLVIDDVNTMRVQIKELLASFGFRKITLASSGEEAKVLLANGQFQLIMSDWHMEPTNGLELLRFVRASEQLKTVPFIMATAESAKENVIEAIKSGVDEYLVKPLTPAQIQNKVYGVLFRKQVLT